MLEKLDDLRKLLKKSGKPIKLALAASEDAHSLGAVVRATEEKIIIPVLVGGYDVRAQKANGLISIFIKLLHQ